MNFRELLNKLDEVDAAGLDQTTAPAAPAAPAAADPAKQAAYARAQAAMANLEKAAQYSGTDEIVRQRYGLPPPLPPIEQWDGKMPAAGEADWLTKNVLGRQAVKDVGGAQVQNTADASTIASAQAQLKQLNDLLAKASAGAKAPAAPAAAPGQAAAAPGQAAAAPGTTAPVKESIAGQLMESFGYTFEADPGFGGTIQKGGWTPPALPGTAPAANPVSNFGSVGQAAAERRAAQEAERLAAQKTAQAAATAAAPAATNAATHAATDAVASAGKMAALKGGAKMLGKALPGVGLAIGAKDAYDRAQKGDYTGAAMSGLSGIAGLVPGIGTAAAMGLDAANIARDYKAGAFDDKPTQAPAAAQTGTTQKGDPKVAALQQKLIAKGAQIKADGIMGPKTKAAMTQFGITSESVAENISSLRAKLAMIEAEQQADEGLGDWLKAGWQGAKALGKTAATAAAPAAQATKTAGANVAKYAAKNPVKAGLGATAAGAALGYGLGGKPAAPAPVANNRPTTQTPSAAPTNTTEPAAIDPATLEQIQQLMSDLSQVNDPEIQAGLAQARKTFNQLPGSQPKPVAADPAAAYGGSGSSQEQSGT
jgi:trimeric autotransporter adhesin